MDYDPDIVAAMDEDFDYNDPDNQLEDNIMELLNAEGSDDECDEEDVRSDFGYSDEERDEVGSLNDDMFMDEETKSRFTEYSLSSSVIRRNDQLTLLDDRFEQVRIFWNIVIIFIIFFKKYVCHIPQKNNAKNEKVVELCYHLYLYFFTILNGINYLICNKKMSEILRTNLSNINFVQLMIPHLAQNLW